jgi:hypothetical protein
VIFSHCHDKLKKAHIKEKKLQFYILYFKLYIFTKKSGRHGVNDVKQTEIHTTEPLVPEHKAFEVQMAIEKLQTYKSPGTDQIPAELIQAGGSTF